MVVPTAAERAVAAFYVIIESLVDVLSSRAYMQENTQTHTHTHAHAQRERERERERERNINIHTKKER